MELEAVSTGQEYALTFTNLFLVNSLIFPFSFVSLFLFLSSALLGWIGWYHMEAKIERTKRNR